MSRSSIWESRTAVWHTASNAIMQRPFLGYGQENFAFIFPSEKLITVDNTHNIFLEILVSSGIFGLITYVSFILIVFKNSDYIVKLFIAAFMLRAFFNPLSLAEIAFFWILAGLYNHSTFIKKHVG